MIFLLYKINHTNETWNRTLLGRNFFLFYFILNEIPRCTNAWWHLNCVFYRIAVKWLDDWLLKPCCCCCYFFVCFAFFAQKKFQTETKRPKCARTLTRITNNAACDIEQYDSNRRTHTDSLLFTLSVKKSKHISITMLLLLLLLLLLFTKTKRPFETMHCQLLTFQSKYKTGVLSKQKLYAKTYSFSIDFWP